MEAILFIHTLCKISDRHNVTLSGEQILECIHAWRGPGVARKARPQQISNEEHNRRLTAYYDCKTDSQAAALLGMNYKSYLHWRTFNDLPTRWRRKRKRLEL